MMIPRKRFGQHFLRDTAIIQRIVNALMVKPDDHLIEIGPGQGALTRYLLKQVNQLEAIELDRDLLPLLNQLTETKEQLIIFNQDVLQVDFNQLKKDDRLLRIVGNLPYNISTPILFHLLNYAKSIADMLFMLQKEVAERIAASVNTAEYGRLSIMVQYHCQVEILFDVPPSAFYPSPKVQSSIIRLHPYHTYPHQAHDEKLFAHLVQQAFNQRRKTLRNSLKTIISDDIWQASMIDSHLRAENLRVEDFVRLSNKLIEKD